jgi:4-amino-4-deoxy-L-arabinose transferase-like glycosyltransferase
VTAAIRSSYDRPRLGRSPTPTEQAAHYAPLLILLVGWATRMFNLTLLPIFLDESIYLTWSQTALQGGLTSGIAEGKGGLVALYALVLPLARNPLWMARFVSAIAGAFAMAGVYVLGRDLFDHQVGVVAMLLYVIAPLAMFHERMGLADPVVNALCIYVAILSVRVAQRSNWQTGFALGVLLALTPMIKASGIFAYAIPAISLVLVHDRRRDGWSFLRALAVAYLIALPVLALLLWSGAGQAEAQGDFDWSALLRHPVLLLISNGAQILGWARDYIGFELPMVALGLLLGLAHRDGSALWLAVVDFVLVGYVFVETRYFPRYLLPALGPSLVLASWGLLHGTRDLLQWLGMLAPRFRPFLAPTRLTLIALVLSLVAIINWAFLSSLLLDPTQAPFPQLDRWQYVEGWPAGYGYYEAARYLKARAQANNGINLFARGNKWGTATSLEVYLGPDDPIAEFDLDKSGFKEVLKLAREHPTFVVINYPREVPTRDWPHEARLVQSYRRLGGDSLVEVWEVKP